MSKLLILITLFFLVSCKPSAEKTTESNDSPIVVNNTRYSIMVEKVDSCEYIVLDGTYGRSIIHKANCKNHEHPKRN